MTPEILLTRHAIPSPPAPPPLDSAAGAWFEFYGRVRGEEAGQPILALDYEAYEEMALREMRRLAGELGREHGCLHIRVVHRLGRVPVGATALYVGVASRHRQEGLAFLAAFIDRLKQEVPIWKRLPAA